MLFYFRMGWYREFDLYIVYRMIVSQSCSVPLHCVKARLEMCSASTQFGTQAGGSTVRSAVATDYLAVAVAVVSELRSGLHARWVKICSRGRQPLWSGVSGWQGRLLSAR